VENKGQCSGGGAGIAAAQQITDEQVEVVLTGNMGPNAYNLMKASGIKVFHAEDGSCQEVIDQYLSGKLSEIIASGPSHAGI
jgi:predicted Fe-Mo cluster-binding NifX family protein